MHTPPPLDLAEHDIVSALSRSWGLRVGPLRYLQVGGGSYHWTTEDDAGHRYFLTVDDLTTKPWLGSDEDSTFSGLLVAYATPGRLQRAGLEFPVAPVRATGRRDSGDPGEGRPARHAGGSGGAPAVRLSQRYSLAVFSYLEGSPGQWGKPINAGDRSRLLTLLAELHRFDIRAAFPRAVLATRMELHWRDELTATLAALDEPWSGGPYSGAARLALADNADGVRALVDRWDGLAAEVTESGAEPVLTHGEPHPGNLIWAHGRLRLLDWDTVGLALPERDLWMLDDGSPDCFSAYTAATGRSVDGAATALFGLTWALNDITGLATLFRFDHQSTPATDERWQGWIDVLSTGRAAPFGRPLL
jgi:spectinomycin phosphotransferase